MKAVICTKYGQPEVLKLGEVNKPAPKKNEVLIKINTTSVTASDCIVRGFKLSKWTPLGFLMGLVIGFKKPRNPVLGMVLAGEIEAIGEHVNLFHPGDQVVAWTIKSGLKIQTGTYAEYICLTQDSLITQKPENASFEETVAIPYGGLLALSFLKKGKIKKGQQVLIYGASGAIGTAAVQICKFWGAKVTGICSTTNLEMVKSLGADNVIDYTKEKITDQNQRYEFILDAVGKKKSSDFKVHIKKLLTPHGKYISVDDGGSQETLKDLELLIQLLEEGNLKPVIDKIYPLEEIIEAHRYVEKGHKKGNIVITIN